MDVVALAEVYKRYSKEMFECFHLDVIKCISPSQYALHVFTSMCTQVGQIYLPHAGLEEEHDRAAYRGGRTTCQFRKFESDDFLEAVQEMAGEIHYDNIHNYLVCPDVNSLYPTVQVKEKYAYGRWKYLVPDDTYNFAAMVQIADGGDPEMESQALETRNLIERSCYCVDVECPRDILTAFLMDRAADGSMTHDLEPKTEYWVC